MSDNFKSGNGQSFEKYKLVFEEHSDYFFACVEAGSISDQLMYEYKQKIAQQISISRCDRVMIKHDMRATSSAVQLCGLINRVIDWHVRKIKYAFVDVDPEQLSTYKMSILYARSRGIEIEAFGDIPAARQWLLASAPPLTHTATA